MPLFSFIIPVYNAEKYLRTCLDSVFAQTYPDFELILVDDGSTDGSGTLCDEYAARDRRAAVLHLSNGGVVRARKAGLDRSSGEYICFVDGDDYVSRDFLEMVRTHIDANGEPDMLLYGYTRNEDGGALLTRRPLPVASGLYDKARLRTEVYPYMLYDCRRPFFEPMIPGFLWMKVGKRELYANHFAQESHAHLLEDVIMVYECMLNANSIFVGAECPYYYRVHIGATQSQYHEDYLSQMALALQYLRVHLGGVDAAIDREIEAFGVARTIAAVTHDLRHGRSCAQTARHIRQCLADTNILSGLNTGGLPIHIRVYIAMLRMDMCYPAALAAKVQLFLAEGRHVQPRM